MLKMKYELDELIHNLNETQQYCNNELGNTEKNFASNFRSINPIIGDESIFKFSLKELGLEERYFMILTEWTKDPYHHDELLEMLFANQKVAKSSAPQKVKNSTKGEILAFAVDETLIDGAAAVCSWGIFDDYNCPPIDTWFYLTETEQGRLLLAWIPEQFVDYVNEGIDVNPEECINWFKIWYPDIYGKIKEKLPEIFVDRINKLPDFLQQ